MQESKLLDVGAVIQAAGVPASTLRYYEAKGLIQSAGRKGLRRQFKASVLKQLSLIALGKRAGFTLDEMQTMLGNDGQFNIDKAQLLAKVNELDDYITQLTAMRDGLMHAVNCSAPSHLECPNFNRLLKLANHPRLKQAAQVNNMPISK